MEYRPALIAVGGFPGTGKTTVCQRLAAELGFPRLSSDRIIGAIKATGDTPDAGRMAYDVLFALCEDFLHSGIPTILDISMGWAFHWRQVDRISAEQPQTDLVAAILRCQRATCLERIGLRAAAPQRHGGPEAFAGQKVEDIWNFLQELERPEAHFVDAGGTADQVYSAVREYVIGRLRPR